MLALWQTEECFLCHVYKPIERHFCCGGGKGAKGGMCPERHCTGSAFGKSKIWNSEIWPLLASWRFHCRQWYFTPSTPNTVTLSQFWDYTLNCQCSTTPHKAVCTPRNTLLSVSDWSFTCCKKIHIVHQLLFNWQSQFNVLHCSVYSRVSKFCIKFENSARNSVSWFSGKSLNLLQPDVKCKAKMHQIQIQLGLHSRNRWGGAYSTPQAF